MPTQAWQNHYQLNPDEVFNVSSTFRYLLKTKTTAQTSGWRLLIFGSATTFNKDQLGRRPVNWQLTIVNLTKPDSDKVEIQR